MIKREKIPMTPEERKVQRELMNWRRGIFEDDGVVPEADSSAMSTAEAKNEGPNKWQGDLPKGIDMSEEQIRPYFDSNKFAKRLARTVGAGIEGDPNTIVPSEARRRVE